MKFINVFVVIKIIVAVIAVLLMVLLFVFKVDIVYVINQQKVSLIMKYYNDNEILRVLVLNHRGDG